MDWLTAFQNWLTQACPMLDKDTFAGDYLGLAHAKKAQCQYYGALSSADGAVRSTR